MYLINFIYFSYVRSFAKINEFPSSKTCYPFPIYSSLQFKGDTLSNEIVDHQFVYPLVHNLLCENNKECYKVYSLLINILTYHWYLVGENHNRTTFEIWNPNDLNNIRHNLGIQGLKLKDNSSM